MFKRVLIANRGEIAVRIIKACQELGVHTIAIYSDVDSGAPHVQIADEAHALGGTTPIESYLNVARVMELVAETGAEAVHPGYGFLSENPGFAETCEKAGIAFIGPTSKSIRAMGSKIEAKTLMERAGVPVIPGYHGTEQGFDELIARAAGVGYPLMVKASAGGGGKGMRIVNGEGELLDALEGARRESIAAFGDGTLFLERFLENPRHIEFQVMADNEGNTIHLFERECSIQRRHQKIIEETPSIALTPRTRTAMGEAAVRAAQAVGYRNAGTVEFMFQDGKFYFLEMNTRLQVEHGITEEVTGVDIVKLQLRIASGEPMTLRQRDLRQSGHAIECRIYAEDPAKDFLPSSGVIHKLQLPDGLRVRHDVGVSIGYAVSPFYDPMLAKLIVSGEDRDDAIRKMCLALQNYVAIGVKTNIPYLRAILEHPAFIDGYTTNRFIERYMSEWTPPKAPPVEALAAAVVHELPWKRAPTAVGEVSAEADPYSPWKTLGPWRPLGGE
ncbi:MAG: acetyl-CoA carboxylase biotin carboxylase subunit [Thermoplasmata archaeon]|nr:acetyl-CoA carboxylase biotin carboxylase subunit [Thermoplasmata archaeon]